MFNFPQLEETKSYFWLNSLHLPCTSTFHLLLQEQEAFYYQISLFCVSTLAITLAFPLEKQFRTEFVFLIYHSVLKKGHEQYLDVHISPCFQTWSAWWRAHIETMSILYSLHLQNLGYLRSRHFSGGKSFTSFIHSFSKEVWGTLRASMAAVMKM